MQTLSQCLLSSRVHKHRTCDFGCQLISRSKASFMSSGIANRQIPKDTVFRTSFIYPWLVLLNKVFKIQMSSMPTQPASSHWGSLTHDEKHALLEVYKQLTTLWMSHDKKWCSKMVQYQSCDRMHAECCWVLCMYLLFCD